MTSGAKKQPKITVLNDNDTTPEVLASTIKAMSESVKKLLDGPVKKRALLILIKDQIAGIGIRDIEMVIDAMSNAARFHLKPKEQQP